MKIITTKSFLSTLNVTANFKNYIVSHVFRRLCKDYVSYEHSYSASKIFDCFSSSAFSVYLKKGRKFEN